MSDIIQIFLKLIKSAVNNNVSDIHLRTGEKPSFRVKGDLVAVKSEPLTKENIYEIFTFLSEGKHKGIKPSDLSEVDGAKSIKGLCRIRFNFLKYQEKFALVLRIITLEVPTVKGLGLSSVIKKIALAKQGLVLVTGATGSGKSSTLAAMINHVNETKPVHILTLEDPVEFIHSTLKAKITQREIGVDTGNFNEALRAALRQDPDIILIGEMRDAETISIALKAAETGHLVFGTIHTTNAMNTIGRLLAMFPPEEQNAVRARLSDNLYATISQRLVKTKDGKGRVAAQEIMIATPGIREAISKPELTHEIYTYISKGKKGLGTHTFDQHIMDLYRKGLITSEEAKKNASSPEDFERLLLLDDDESA